MSQQRHSRRQQHGVPSAAAAALRDDVAQRMTFPDSLPITSRLDDIRTALQSSQVVVIAGETGSGKTTQLPKLCLSMGLGTKGMIGHTQPRRIAARSVAERISEELNVPLGGLVGYSVRFTDEVSDDTVIKVMTDGILLQEIHHDRLLRKYDTIIIDEAHERSLNIDFLLGYLKQILPKRPDLHVIITSATIETQRFADHFAVQGTKVPIIEVSGRTYPVELRYRPPLEDDDPLDSFLATVDELYQESHVSGGDILAFFPGEREIHEAQEALNSAHYAHLDVLPLYGRLSASEQHRVFEPHSRQRIVLATNVAETSLTVPGIRYVIDTGTARISRYSHRTKIQRLPIEPISQASARQRAGRCGRLSDGIAIRLYSEEDFESRPPNTDPEILRTNLAAVILKMADLGFGDIEKFPFLDTPELSSIRDGVTVLRELGALRDNMRLTKVGRTLARIPVDPRLARMLVAAQQNNVLGDVLIIVAGLSLQDIRERPTDKQEQADQLHARFLNSSSDFLSYLQLWDYLTQQRRNVSRSAFRKLCKKEFLHWIRYFEWVDLVGQLTEVCHDLKWSWSPHSLEGGVDEEVIAQVLLTGILSHIGARIGDTREFQGTRGKRFAIFPSSGVKRKSEFVMAHEIVETSRVWGRTVSRIEPEWVEKVGGSQVRYRYSDPFWSTKRAEAQAYRSSSLWGVPLVQEKRVSFRSIDPEASRQLFLLHALVLDEWNDSYPFIAHNRRIIGSVREFEEKARQRGAVADEETLATLYGRRIPQWVSSGTQFRQWWRRASAQQRARLNFSSTEIQSAFSSGEDETLYPGELSGFTLRYTFEPGSPEDGITVLVPLPQLAGLTSQPFEWLVPGFQQELIVATLRGLPKEFRRQLIPLPDTAREVGTLLITGTGNFHDHLATALQQKRGVAIPADLIAASQIPDHLRMRYAAVGKNGKILDTDRSLTALQHRQGTQTRKAVRHAFAHIERGPFATWDSELGDIPRQVSDGGVTAFPALVSTPEGWQVSIFAHQQEAAAAQLEAVVQLVSHNVPSPRKQLFNGITQQQLMALRSYPRSEGELRENAHECAIRDLVILGGGAVWSWKDFHELHLHVEAKLAARERAIALLAVQAIQARTDLLAVLPDSAGDDLIAEIRDQIEWLSGAGFIGRLGSAHLRDIPRYFSAAEARTKKAIREGSRWGDRITPLVEDLYMAEDTLWELFPDPEKDSAAARQARWLIEEFKVSIFAQHLGTRQKVSPKVIEDALAPLGSFSRGKY